MKITNNSKFLKENFGDDKDYSEDIQRLFKKWFKENADLGIRAWQRLTDSYYLEIDTKDKGEGSKRRRLYKVVNNSPFVEVEDYAEEIGNYIANSIPSLEFLKFTYNDKSVFFSDDEEAGNITWYFRQQIGIPDFGAEFDEDANLDEAGANLDVHAGVDIPDDAANGIVSALPMLLASDDQELKEDNTWAKINIDRALESGVHATQYQDVDGVKNQYYFVVGFESSSDRADARKYCKSQGWSAVNNGYDKSFKNPYSLVVYIPEDKLPEGVNIINNLDEAGIDLGINAGVDISDDAANGIVSALPMLLASEDSEDDLKEGYSLGDDAESFKVWDKESRTLKDIVDYLKDVCGIDFTNIDIEHSQDSIYSADFTIKGIPQAAINDSLEDELYDKFEGFGSPINNIQLENWGGPICIIGFDIDSVSSQKYRFGNTVKEIINIVSNYKGSEDSVNESVDFLDDYFNFSNGNY